VVSRSSIARVLVRLVQAALVAVCAVVAGSVVGVAVGSAISSGTVMAPAEGPWLRVASPGSAGRVAGSPTVAASREPLTTDPRSPVAHDTEVDALVIHAHRLFAATDQWEYPGPSPAGQVLVKDGAGDPWRVFERTRSVRVQALDSFAVPPDQGLGHGHSLLITQAIVGGRSRIQWLLDGARAFTIRDSHALASDGADVRSFGAHESGGVWAVYAGVNPTGILRGTWSRRRRTLVFARKPELTVAAPGSPGLKTQKVTGFADCGGALYVTINTRLYRRNDGRLPRGVARWVLVYQEGPVGPFNSGLRGITCVTHDGSPALLISTEGDGDVYRFDRLPHGRLDASPAASPGHGVTGLRPILEFSPIPAIRRMLGAQGTHVPATGEGSIAYVIAAYNNGDFMTIRTGGRARQLFGLEWGYEQACPVTRTCGPTAFGGVTFDAAACFAIRTDRGASPAYSLRCLHGPGLTPAARPGDPIRSGQAFVSIRTIQPSPFDPGRLFYGGYDCNFYPADGTAWVATSTVAALHLTR
jgi:hypothetical protein